MKVTLTAYPPSPVRQMYLAAKRCTTATLDVNEEVEREEMERVVKNCIKAGHLTVCEFATFNFHIEQITRSCSHQLVRHRHASFCQQSQRRVQIGTEEEAAKVFRYAMDKCQNPHEPILPIVEILSKYYKFSLNRAGVICASFCDYWTMLRHNLPTEQARDVLLECTYTNLMMSVNFRELMHICALRMCEKAEKEIRGLANALALAVSEIPTDGPFLTLFLRPKCFQNERCSESKPCGVYKWEK